MRLFRKCRKFIFRGYILENLLMFVSEPTGLWQTLINFFEDFLLNYAWAIILLTICIKLILTPLDFLNKKVARDNARMQAAVAPQMAKLQKQYLCAKYPKDMI